MGDKLTILHLLNGEWQRQMSVPLHIHVELNDHIRSLCQSGEDRGQKIEFFPVHLRDDALGLAIDFEVRVAFSPGVAGEDVLLELQRPPYFPEGATGSEVA